MSVCQKACELHGGGCAALQVHVTPTPAQQQLVRGQLGWEPWSGSLYPTHPSRAATCGPALAGVSLEVQVRLGGVGLSLVGQGEELLYGRITGIQVRAVTGVARQTLELAVQQVQVLRLATAILLLACAHLP